MDILRRNVVCTVVTLKVCVACAVLSFPSLAMSKDFPLKTTLSTMLVAGNIGPVLALLIAFTTNTFTKVLAKVVRIGLGIHSLLSKVVVVATLCAIGLHVTKETGLPVCGVAALFSGSFIEGMFGNNLTRFSGIVVVLIVALIVGFLLS